VALALAALGRVPALCAAPNSPVVRGSPDPARTHTTDSTDEESNDNTKAAPLERVTFRQNGQQHSIKGRTVTDVADGGLLFQSVAGELWSIERTDLDKRETTDQPFKPLTQAELAEQIVAESPAGFRTLNTPHYVVCYNTSRAYAQWTSSLLERLYKAFTNYWQHQGFELRDPEFPLPVVVFADRASYDAASRTDLPAGTGTIVGFYSLRSNRINMFDLTGTEGANAPPAQEVGGSGFIHAKARQASTRPNRRGSMREINQMLSQPAAVPLVATIVHEATHQIAFNCGMQQRYADIPLWLCEGMAVYFEAPDLASRSGWQGIGRVNYPRLDRFRKNLGSWHDGSLEEMLRDSKRFRDPHTALDAYADAWALNYYLIKYEPKAYTAYLKLLAQKRPLIEDDPKTRLAEFRKHFGDLKKLEQDFLKQMARVK
jgi:hypothetical protein